MQPSLLIGQRNEGRGVGRYIPKGLYQTIAYLYQSVLNISQ